MRDLTQPKPKFVRMNPLKDPYLKPRKIRSLCTVLKDCENEKHHRFLEYKTQHTAKHNEAVKHCFDDHMRETNMFNKKFNMEEQEIRGYFQVCCALALSMCVLCKRACGERVSCLVLGSIFGRQHIC